MSRRKISYTVWENEGTDGGFGYEGFKTKADAMKKAAKCAKKPGRGVTEIVVTRVEIVATLKP
jgi:hypothetical protein